MTASKKERKPISTGSEWTFDLIRAYDREISRIAERYALDHHGIDESFWVRMRAAYTDREIVELSMCIGSWLAFGRLNHVLGIDGVCTLPSP